MKIFRSSIIWKITIILFFSISLSSAQGTEDEKESADYISLYNNGDYAEALKILREKLQLYYDKKTDYLRIPNDLIYIDREKDKKDLNYLFRQRTVKKNFIEENSDLFQLHLFTARCYFKIGEENSALNHYYNSLRYKQLQPQKDDYIYYEISQVYKSLKYFNAYLTALETAYSLKPTEYEYSLELGKSLSSTKEKKKAIFHLERYIESKGDDVDESLYLTLGNLNEDTGKYLETAKYYKKYLQKKSRDGYVNFALGYIAYKRIGNHKLALECLKKSLEYLPENDFFRRSKAAEYQADIYMSDREFDRAIEYYNQTKIYHDKILKEIENYNNKIAELKNKIQEIKSSMKSKDLYNRYTEYQSVNEEKGKIELANREMQYEFEKLNSGHIRWNLAELFERTARLEQAIKYYGEAIAYDYNSNNARDKINKLKLKINRGY